MSIENERTNDLFIMVFFKKSNNNKKKVKKWREKEKWCRAESLTRLYQMCIISEGYNNLQRKRRRLNSIELGRCIMAVLFITMQSRCLFPSLFNKIRQLLYLYYILYTVHNTLAHRVLYTSVIIV